MIGEPTFSSLTQPRTNAVQIAASADSLVAANPSALRIIRFGVKQTLDVLLSLFGLLLLAPFLLLVALAIKLTSDGPVLFWQDRIGQDGRIFSLCKFRTMYIDDCDASGVRQAVAGDSRVTLIGAVLRRRSIDELPQLLNVLMGDMSLVGPRAQVPDMLVCGLRYPSAVPSYYRRHVMRPGITGLAQVRGLRGPVLDLNHANRRIESDLEYIANFSLLGDLEILVRTVVQEVARGSGV